MCSVSRPTKHLGWTRHQRSFDDLDLLNQLLAVSETIAHLEVLHLQKHVDRGDGGRITFALRGRGEAQLCREDPDWSLTDGRPF